jgi:hypothetical protein
VAADDRSDPAVRAAHAMRDAERRDRAGRVLAAALLTAIAMTGPVVAAPVTGEPGATVGAVVGSVLLAGLAVAVWPWAWSADERRHRELEAIWAEVRGDGDATPWDRFAAWADTDADGDRVELVLVCRAGSTNAPSPLGTEVVERLDPDDIAAAAAAMERLREEAREREAASRERHLASLAAAERREYEEALARVDRAAEEQQQRAEAQMRRELAAQEADERRAQAAAVARALRRP